MHQDIFARPADDWTIVINFVDANSNPLDLTNAEIFWTLLDWNATIAIPTNAGTIALAGPPTNGIVTVTLPAAVTEKLAPGRYTDFARITFTDGDVSCSTDTGTILVGANPMDP